MMKNSRLLIIAITLFLCSFSSLLMADYVGLHIYAGTTIVHEICPFSTHFFGHIPWLLFEGLIIVHLARSTRPHRWRFVSIWFVVTSLIWLMFFLLSALGLFGSVIITQFIIVLVEVKIIWSLLRWSFLVEQTALAPTLLQALIYSAIANFNSYTTSYGIDYIFP